jgi:asparagine synthase (glutamine-hydrolysing)
MEEVSPQAHRHSFSIAFSEGEIDETKYQRQMASLLGTTHHEIRMDDETIAALLRDMVLHCECPVKESFNTCAFALSRSVREAGVTVVLAGQGADELFGGYPGYRFDVLGPARRASADPLEEALEEEMRERAWGDRDLFYERSLVELQEVRTALYSPQVNAQFPDFDCLAQTVVDPERLRGRSPVHQRSYLDFKLRLGEHLLSEHGDRMVMANSVEGRYPFLDIELVEFARRIPSRLKVNAMGEKYIVKRAAEPWVPQSIIEREKFGFRAPDSSMLLRSGGEWVHDLLSSDRIRRQGYFNAGVVDTLKRRYSQAGFRLHPHLETDLLMVVLTFGLLIDLFDLPSLN